ncbi:putative protein OS=Ureibacillus acetophenoni OX=614649 GN=SAMN05877842_10275 PE=4 SV=1 [Ureibacillus acetophenoni]
MKKQPNKWMKYYAVGLIVLFIIQSILFWDRERVLSYFNIICAIVVIFISFLLYKNKNKE